VSDIKIEDVRRLVVGPDDILVITLPENASAKQFHEISKHVKRHFPEDCRGLVLTSNIDIQVVEFEKAGSE